MSFFEELKRRNVFRVGVAYAVSAWVLLQFIDLVLENIQAPDWIMQVFMLALAVGFPLAIFFAWAFEVTPDGVKRESEVDRSQSVTKQTGSKLNLVIFVAMGLALAWFAWDKFSSDLPSPMIESRQEASTPGAVTESPTPEKSIAVLPFTTRSTSEEDQFFSDGMHDDLLTQLAKIGSLKVISRTSVMEYRDTTKNLKQIGGELGVANILEGAVQRVGNQVRINIQLIDANTDEHLWAETYDRELSIDNLLVIQSEIARAITGELKATLNPEEQVALERKLTDNLEAMTAYRSARILSQFFIKADLERAEVEIRHALELDPEFAAAWAELAYIRMSRYWGGEPDEIHLEIARNAIDRGREISPDLPELDIAEGYYFYWGHLDYARALSVLEPALKTYPNDADLLQVVAFVNRRAGNIDKAIEYMKRGLVLAPRETSLIYTLGETYGAMQQFDEAQFYLDMLLAIDPSTARGYQLQAYQMSGRNDDYKAAARYLKLAQDLDFLFDEYWLYLVLAGDYEGALEITKGPEQKFESKTSTPRDMLDGLTYLYSGDLDSAQPLLINARQQLQSRLESRPGDVFILMDLCTLSGALRETAESVVQCQAALEALPDDAYSKPVWLSWIAEGLAMGGHREMALEIISSVFEYRFGPSFNDLKRNPAYKSLHQSERWKSLFDNE